MSGKSKREEETFEEIEVDGPEEGGESSLRSHDLAETMVGFLSLSNLKFFLFIFLFFLFVSSEAFIDKVLTSVPGATEHRMPTTKGVFVQALILILLLMAADLLLRAGFP